MQSSRSREIQNASERATMRKSGFRRATTAARMRAAVSASERRRLRRAGVLACAGVVFDVDRRGTGALERLHGAPYGCGLVEAALGIRDHRYFHRPGDGARLLDERIEREKTGIGQGKAARCR